MTSFVLEAIYWMARGEQTITASPAGNQVSPNRGEPNIGRFKIKINAADEEVASTANKACGLFLLIDAIIELLTSVPLLVSFCVRHITS